MPRPPPVTTATAALQCPHVRRFRGWHPAGHPSLGSRMSRRSARRLRSRGCRSMSDAGDAMVRCRRCARASSSRTISSSRSRPGVRHEVEELGVGVGGVGSVPEHPAEIVEVGRVQRGADLVDPLEVVRDPAEGDPLVVVVDQRRRPSRMPATRCRRAGRGGSGAARGSPPPPARSRGSRRCTRTPTARRSRTTRGTTASRCRAAVRRAEARWRAPRSRCRARCGTRPRRDRSRCR